MRSAHFFVVCLFSLLAGCAVATPPLLPSDRPRDDTGYLYGRFSLTPFQQSCRLGVGLVFSNLTSEEREEYVITFRQADDVAVIAVAPGEYAADTVVFLYEDGAVQSRKPFSERKRKFSVGKGKAYYVGDYVATTNCVLTPPRVSDYEWSMEEATRNFKQTTADFIRTYVYFKEIVQGLE